MPFGESRQLSSDFKRVRTLTTHLLAAAEVRDWAQVERLQERRRCVLEHMRVNEMRPNAAAHDNVPARGEAVPTPLRSQAFA